MSALFLFYILFLLFISSFKVVSIPDNKHHKSATGTNHIKEPEDFIHIDITQ